VIARSLLPDTITYLQDSIAVIDGVRFYGSPWQPKFGSTWAFNVERGIQAAEKWARIDPDVEVLITHGPPYGIGDRARRRATFDRGESFELVGCRDLSERIEKLEKVKLHVFGHIHEGYGAYPPFEEGEQHHVNASICDEDYRFLNKPIVFDV
jgi:Icc-related predicted phosphoesterase